MAEAKIGLRGDKTNNWKGDNIQYRALHNWLIKTFGYPDKCEFCGVNGERKHRWNIQYALIKGMEYIRDRKNFICLCCSCHKKYDTIQ